MKELLEKLITSELLTEETKTALTEAVAKMVEEAKAAAKEEAILEAKAEYAIQFVADKEALVEAVDTKVEQLLKGHMDELVEDIERFRDLEAEYAAKLVEAREEMAKILESDMNELVNTLDTFVEMRLTEELNELKEDIELVKQNELGRKIFETFKGEVVKHISEDNGTAASLTEAQKQLKKTQEELTEAKKKLESISREAEMSNVLESLQGRPREIMEAILKSVPTNKLQEAYNNFIGRVLHESAKDVAEKETSDSSEKVLAENEGITEAVVATKTVTGDTTPIVENVQPASTEELARIERLRRMAGIK